MCGVYFYYVICETWFVSMCSPMALFNVTSWISSTQIELEIIFIDRPRTINVHVYLFSAKKIRQNKRNSPRGAKMIP